MAAAKWVGMVVRRLLQAAATLKARVTSSRREILSRDVSLPELKRRYVFGAVSREALKRAVDRAPAGPFGHGRWAKRRRKPRDGSV